MGKPASVLYLEADLIGIAAFLFELKGTALNQNLNSR